MKLFLSYFTALLCIACSNTTKQSVNKESVYKLTKSANDESLQGHIEKNVDKILSVYTDDAIILPPGGAQPVRGVVNIRQYYNNQLSGPGKTVEVSTDTISFEVTSEYDAVELGTYKLTYVASDTSSATEFTGEMLIVWKKVDGAWKISADMWH